MNREEANKKLEKIDLKLKRLEDSGNNDETLVTEKRRLQKIIWDGLR